VPEAVIVSALRTPIGTARKGTLRDTTAYELAHHVVSEAAADLDPGSVDDVILGEGLYGGGVLARHAAVTVRSWASVGVDPAATGLAPVKAIPKALARADLSISDVDLFEINEAFAAMCVATVKLLDLDPDRVNVSGSGCSLGHPVAATGARMLVTLVHELRRRGGGVGVAAMCAGGGMGSATVIEVPAG
jgi:acetyl-CoA acetyltransferase